MAVGSTPIVMDGCGPRTSRSAGPPTTTAAGVSQTKWDGFGYPAADGLRRGYLGGLLTIIWRGHRFRQHTMRT
jgi:hypothetical protein